MKRNLLVGIYFCIVICNCFSQKNDEGKKYSIKIYRSEEFNAATSGILEGSYRFNKDYETGIYVGYDYQKSKGVLYGNTLIKNKYQAYKIGVNVRRYFLKADFWLRPYVSGILGLHHYKSQYAGYPQNKGVNVDWGFYGGVKSRVHKSLSVFAEAGYGDLGTMHLGISLDI